LLFFFALACLVGLALSFTGGKVLAQNGRPFSGGAAPAAIRGDAWPATVERAASTSSAHIIADQAPFVTSPPSGRSGMLRWRDDRDRPAPTSVVAGRGAAGSDPSPPSGAR